MRYTKQEQITTVKMVAKELAAHYSISALTNVIESEGWRLLGEGFFSKVYGNPEYPDIALKVCHKHEDSWPFFAKFCRDHADSDFSIHLPSVHSFDRLKADRGLYVAVLDRLKPFDTDWDVKVDQMPVSVEAVFDMQVGISRHSAIDLNAYIMQLHGFFPDTEEDLDADPDRLYDYSNTQRNECIAIARADVEGRNSLLYQATKCIREELVEFCTLDLHTDNMMLTEDGEVVITDPVSFSRSDSNQEVGI